jgi:hypothetical protein
VTGTVTSIKVIQAPILTLVQHMAVIVLKEANGQTETFFLWLDSGLAPVITPAVNWLERNVNLSLLREALVNNLQVTVFTDPSSGNINAVQLLGA